MSVDELIFHAALACKHEGEQEPIDKAICDTAAVESAPVPVSQFEVVKFVPFDPVRKRTEATLRAPSGEVFLVSKGSPQVTALALRRRAEPTPCYALMMSDSGECLPASARPRQTRALLVWTVAGDHGAGCGRGGQDARGGGCR